MNNATLYPDFSILLVDDDAAWLRSLRLTLACSAGITNVTACDNSAEVMNSIADSARPGRVPVGLVLLDLTMPSPDGEELLRRIGEQYPEIPVIMISGMNQLSMAVQCIKRGAFDYFVKTDPQEYLIKGIKQAIRSLELQRINREMHSRMLSGELQRPEVFNGFITVSPLMLSVFQYLESVARSSQPVLISGESGVGKELLAHAVHELSGRSGPLVTLNVAGIDDNIFSDTLFGHSAGAFTGAAKSRRGLVERAAGGTLFLDEIGDLPPQSQIKLLRLLQEGEYYPLGSDIPGQMKARIVAATHHDLKALEVQGLFRRDLYHRMHVHYVHIPPLRERPDDIPALLNHFTALAAAEYSRPVPEVSLSLSENCASTPFPATRANSETWFLTRWDAAGGACWSPSTSQASSPRAR